MVSDMTEPGLIIYKLNILFDMFEFYSTLIPSVTYKMLFIFSKSENISSIPVDCNKSLKDVLLKQFCT